MGTRPPKGRASRSRGRRGRPASPGEIPSAKQDAPESTAESASDDFDAIAVPEDDLPEDDLEDEVGGYCEEWKPFKDLTLQVDVPIIPMVPASRSVRDFIKARSELRRRRKAAIEAMRMLVDTPNGTVPVKKNHPWVKSFQDWARYQVGLIPRDEAIRRFLRRRNPRKVGRPTKLTYERLAAAEKRWPGADDRTLAKELKVSRTTVLRVRDGRPRIGRKGR